MPDQQQRELPRDEAPWNKHASPFEGPRSPNIDKPNTEQLLKKMRHVDSERARKYRQRSGE